MSYVTDKIDFHESGAYQHQRKQLQEQLHRLQVLECNVVHHVERATALVGNALGVTEKFIPRRKVKVNGDQIFCPEELIKKDLSAAMEILYDLIRETHIARETP